LLGCSAAARLRVAGHGGIRRRLVSFVVGGGQLVEEARGVALERLRQLPGGTEERRAPFLEVAEELARRFGLGRHHGLLQDGVQHGLFFPRQQLGFAGSKFVDRGRDHGAQPPAAFLRSGQRLRQPAMHQRRRPPRGQAQRGDLLGGRLGLAPVVIKRK
jgi:hypothetical protein